MQQPDPIPGLYVKTTSRKARGRAKTRPARQTIAVTTTVHQIFEVYIPEGLRALDATERFIQRITSFCEGATAYQGGEGLWHGQTEEVQVVRISIQIVDAQGKTVFDIDAVRDGVRQAAEQLMIDLAGEGHFEHAIFFNDWTAQGTFVRRQTRAAPPKTRARPRQARKSGPSRARR